MSLKEKRCIPCEGGALPLFRPKAEELLREIPDWQLNGTAKEITRLFTFNNFAEALAFANKVGALAEEENHHPDMLVSWGKVRVDLSTHSIGGLSENDFILASKIDSI